MKYCTGEIVELEDNINCELFGIILPGTIVYIHENEKCIDGYEWCKDQEYLSSTSIAVEWKFPDITANLLWPNNPEKVISCIITTIDEDIYFLSRKYPGSLLINNVHIDPVNESLDKQYKLLINIEANLLYKENNKNIFDLRNITVVELAQQLLNWLQDKADSDFHFKTMDDEEENIFNLVKEINYWSISSCWENEKSSFKYSDTMLKCLIEYFIYDVTYSVQKILGIDCTEYGILKRFG